MHPKSSQDLDVSDEEMTELQGAFEWFTENTLEVMELGMKALKKDVRGKITKEQGAELDRALESIEKNG